MTPAKPQPASRVLAAAMREQIESGALVPGDQLPSERSLATEHAVARNTAREAVRLLAESGLVTAEHGRGVFVRDHPRLMRFGQHRYSQRLRNETGLSPYRAEVLAQNKTPRVDCTSITRVLPPAVVAERLRLNELQDDVVRRENWYYADDEPVQVGVTWAPWSIVDGTPIADSGDTGIGSIYARFEDQGYVVTTIREEVTTRMPSHSEVCGLIIPEGVPVLDVMHTSHDASGTPFEVTQFVLRGDRNGLDYTMKVDD